jgi:hypothetical protein
MDGDTANRITEPVMHFAVMDLTQEKLKLGSVN